MRACVRDLGEEEKLDVVSIDRSFASCRELKPNCGLQMDFQVLGTDAEVRLMLYLLDTN